jgi:hypothetical protein
MLQLNKIHHTALFAIYKIKNQKTYGNLGLEVLQRFIEKNGILTN